ncbi:MAG: D-xylose transporter XylE [Rikenellaceae bacterium]
MKNNNIGSKGYLYAVTSVAILGGLLFGYDTAVVSGAEKGLQGFFSAATDFDYTDALHGITSSSALIGCVLGGLLSGFFANRLGRRNSLRLAAVLFFLSALGSYYPEFLFFEYGKPTKELLVMFNFYRVIGGLGVGLASAVCPMYIAEIAPAKIRGTLISCNQFAIIFGMLVVYFVSYLIRLDIMNAQESMEAVGWRRMFVSEAVPAGLFGLLLLFVPKTPRYLVLTGHYDSAFKVLARINGKKEADVILENIKSTSTEKSEKLMSYGWLVIFIGVALSIFQQAVGINVVLYYAPRIFETMGASGDSSMIQTVVMGIVNILFTLVAIFTVDRFGRKPLLIIGSIGMFIGMLALSILSFNESIGMVALISIIVYTASFMMSWGPICWVLIAEIFPNTIRGKAVAIAVAAQWIANFIVSSTFISLSSWSVGGTYLIYAFFSILSALFVWRLVPETKGKTLEDMTKLWRK